MKTRRAIIRIRIVWKRDCKYIIRSKLWKKKGQIAKENCWTKRTFHCARMSSSTKIKDARHYIGLSSQIKECASILWRKVYTKSWKEKEKRLRGNERIIKKYYAIKKRMIIAGKTFDRLLGERKSEGSRQVISPAANLETPIDHSKDSNALPTTSRTLRDTWTPLARFASLINSKKQRGTFSTSSLRTASWILTQ